MCLRQPTLPHLNFFGPFQFTYVRSTDHGRTSSDIAKCSVAG
jgi:hypothetical protein